MSEGWTDDDRFSLVEQMREKQRQWFKTRPEDRPPSLIREAKALEIRPGRGVSFCARGIRVS